jgi:Flp pilus assembly protein TadG
MTAAPYLRKDRGETSIQTVLLVPVILGILFLIVHAAVITHAGQVASLAASRGAQLAASSEGTSYEMQLVRQEIQRTINDLGNNLQSTPQITMYRGTVSVAVQVSTPRIVPFLPYVISRTASAPMERFIEEQDRL